MMVERYKEVYKGGISEIVEKKSRFIATVRQVVSEEEALAFIEEMKKKYWDATHNCYAFVLGLNAELFRYSDDGEPGGTAGRPMLEVLIGEKIRNTAVVVSRYFGGTLLGTGGLVRAYQKAVKEGIACSTVIEKQYALKMKIETEYTGVGKVQYLMGKNKYPILSTDYTEGVCMIVLIPILDVDQAKTEIIEATSGQVKMEDIEQVYYATIDGKTEFFRLLSNNADAISLELS